MEHTILNSEELQRRCEEVFCLGYGDEIYDACINNGKTVITMSELDNDYKTVYFDYEPDMSERPQALDYLMGKRNDFND